MNPWLASFVCEALMPFLLDRDGNFDRLGVIRLASHSFGLLSPTHFIIQIGPVLLYVGQIGQPISLELTHFFGGLSFKNTG